MVDHKNTELTMKKFLSILVCVLALLVTSCDDKNEVTPAGGEISIDAQTLAFKVDGTSLNGNSINVTSSGDWRLTTNQTWCQPSATSGKNGAKVTFTVEPNGVDDTREATFLFMCGDKTVEMTLVQGAEEVMDYLFTTTNYTIAATGGFITLPIRSNIEMEYEASADWIELDINTKATSDKWMHFRIVPNTTESRYEGRSGSLTLFKGTAYERVITIEQSKHLAMILSVTADTVTLDRNTYKVDVQSNLASYSISNSASAWASWAEVTASGPASIPGMTLKTYEFTVQQSPATRTVTFTFSATGATSSTFKLTQRNTNPTLYTIPDRTLRDALAALGYIVIHADKDNQCELLYAGATATSVSLSSRGLTTIEGLSLLPAVTNLTLSNNTTLDYNSLAKELPKMPTITTLSMSQCGTTSLTFLRNVTGLKILSLSYNALTSLDGIQHMSSLMQLTINNNQLTSLEPIENLTQLTTLNFSLNNIKKADISKLTNLTSVTYSTNPLEEFNVGNLGLSSITTLTLTSAYFYIYESSGYTYFVPKTTKITGSKVQTINMRVTSTNYDAMESIDVSACPALKSIDCRRASQKCTELWLSRSQNVTTITKDAITTVMYVD